MNRTLLIYALIALPLMVWLTMVLLRGLRAFRPREHATCGRCSYALTGLDDVNGPTACPECGARLQDVGVVGRYQYVGPSMATWLGLWTLLAAPTLVSVFYIGLSNGPVHRSTKEAVWLRPVMLESDGSRRFRPIGMLVETGSQGLSWRWMPGDPKLDIAVQEEPETRTSRIGFNAFQPEGKQNVQIKLRAPRGGQVAELLVFQEGQLMTNRTHLAAWLRQVMRITAEDDELQQRADAMADALLALGTEQPTLVAEGWSARIGSFQIDETRPMWFTVVLALVLCALYAIGPVLYVRASRRAEAAP